MNRIFRIVWNRALGQMVVVSELGRSRVAAGANGVSRSVKAGSSFRAGVLGAGILLGLAAASTAAGHTITIGYANSGNNALTFWYGTYHNTHFPEGALTLSGPLGTTTTNFTLYQQTRPAGLVDGDTNFWSNGTTLVGYDTYGKPVLTWQGMEFTGLVPGTYTFTYVPIAVPTQDWHPIDNVILSNSVTVITADLNVTAPRISTGGVSDPATLDPSEPVIFDGGTLRPTAPTTLDQGVSVGSNGGMIETGLGQDLTLNGDIDGRGLLTKTGEGTLVIAGNNTSVGGLAMHGGVVSVASDSALGDPSASLSFDGGTLNTTADITNGRDITLHAGGGTFDTNAGTTLTNSGTISGVGGLTKEGDGSLALTGNNSFSGGLDIDTGTVQVSSDANLGTGTVAIGDGTLQAAGDFTTDNAVTLTDVNATIDTQNHEVGISGVIDGSGALNKAGSGTLALSGNNGFSGGLNIDAGTVQVSSHANFGTGTVAIGDGTLQAAGDFTTDNALTLTDANATIDTQNHDVSITGAVDGAGGLVKNGAGTLMLDGVASQRGGTTVNDGTLILNGANTYTGGTTLNGGTLQIANDGDLGDTSGNLVFNGGTLHGTADINAAREITLDSGNGTIVSDSGTTFASSGDIDGTGSLAKSGGGILLLTGNNGFSGGLDIDAGIVRVSSDANLGTGTVAIGDGTLQAAGDFTTDNAVTLINVNATIDTQNHDVGISGAIDGSGALNKAGGGTLALSGNNSFSGGLNIGTGIVQVSSDANLGAGTITIGDAALQATASFTTDNSVVLSDANSRVDTQANDIAITGIVDGTGALNKSGSGKLILDGANTYTGATSIAAGTLALSGAGDIASSNQVINHGTLDISATNAGASITALTGSGQVQLGAKTLTLTDAAGGFAGSIAGAGSVAIGHGTQSLSGNNTFSGGLLVNGGTLQVATAANLGAGTVTLGTDAVLQTTGSFDAGNAFVLKGATSTIDTAGSDVVLTGNVSGAGTLNKVGAGTLTLTGTNNQNGINVKGGTLAFDSDAALGAAGGVITIADNTTLRSLADLTISHALYVDDTRSAVFDTGGYVVSIAGDIGGSGVVQKLGAGVLTLSGNNSQVLMEVQGGSIAVASQGAAGAMGGEIYIGTDGNFTTLSDMMITQRVHVTGDNGQFNTNGNDVTLRGVIDGKACFIKSGEGRLDLRGGGSNDIGACIEQGDLAFNSTFTGNVWVYQGAIASGSGRIVGDVDVKGSLSPGNSPGHLQVAGSVTQQAGSRLLMDVDGPAPGIGAGHYDTLELIGASSVYTAGGTLAPRLRDITGDANNTFVPAIGDTFHLVYAEGGVQGSYAALAQPGAGLPENARFDVRYTPNEVVLAITANSYRQLLAATSTGNAASAGAAIDGVRNAAGARSMATGQLQDELLGMNTAQLAHTFQQLGGEVHADLMNAVAQSGYRLQSTVRQRMAGPMNDDTVASPVQQAELGQHFWTTTIHASGRIDESSMAQGYGFNSDALVIGLDNRISEHFVGGAGLAYSRNAVHAGWLGDGQQSSYQAFAYGVWQAGGNYVNGIVGYAADSYSIDRLVALSSNVAQLSSSPDGHSLSADVEAGKRFDLGGWAITPAIGASRGDVHRDAVTEHGAQNAALSMASSTVTSLRGRLGARISTSFAWSNWNVSPHLDVFAVTEFGDKSAVISSRLQGTAAFDTAATAPGRNGLQVGAGVVVGLADNATLYLDYQSDQWRHASAHEFRAGLRIAF